MGTVTNALNWFCPRRSTSRLCSMKRTRNDPYNATTSGIGLWQVLCHCALVWKCDMYYAGATYTCNGSYCAVASAQSHLLRSTWRSTLARLQNAWVRESVCERRQSDALWLQQPTVRVRIVTSRPKQTARIVNDAAVVQPTWGSGILCRTVQMAIFTPTGHSRFSCPEDNTYKLCADSSHWTNSNCSRCDH